VILVTLTVTAVLSLMKSARLAGQQAPRTEPDDEIDPEPDRVKSQLDEI
jgi:hypothetical protein